MRSKSKKDSMVAKEPLTKTQKNIIHWVRKNVPIKKTKFLHSHVVEYFTGSKAVDMLCNDSPWAKANAKEGSEFVFEFREDAVNFMDEMLKNKMFHRGKKIPVTEKKRRKKKEVNTSGNPDKNDEGTGTDTPVQGSTNPLPTKKRKIRLEMHLDQIFIDSQDAYVWLYDPIPLLYWFGGSVIVLGIIMICLFPLWPPIMRQGVHYLSIATAGLLIMIISLGFLKYIVFVVLYALTGGNLSLWIFPNLTEDVGFFESFVPVYQYTLKKSAKKEKESDNEDYSEDESDSDNSKKGFEMVEKTDTEM